MWEPSWKHAAGLNFSYRKYRVRGTVSKKAYNVNVKILSFLIILTWINVCRRTRVLNFENRLKNNDKLTIYECNDVCHVYKI